MPTDAKDILASYLAEQREAVARIVEATADLHGDGRLYVAAAIIRGNSPGRNAIDDESALNYARTLLSTGVARSKHDACKRSAQLFSENAHSEASMIRRLFKKF